MLVCLKQIKIMCDAFIRISPAKLVYFDPDSDLSGVLSIKLGKRDWGDGYLAMDRLRNAVIFCPEYSQQNRRACHEISFLVGVRFLEHALIVVTTPGLL
jgi:hypothetical protein